MSNRQLVSNRPSTKRKIRKILKNPPKLSISRTKFSSHLQIMDFSNALAYSKSPAEACRNQHSTILSRKHSYHLPSCSASPLSKRGSYMKPLKKRHRPFQQSTKLSIDSISSRISENLRYNDKSLENQDSYKNFNGVSTPPEEDICNKRNASPFSDVIERELRDYIDQPFVKVLNKPGDYVEDSYQILALASGKRKLPEPPRTPPPFSIYSKMGVGYIIKPRSRKLKSNN